MHALLIEHGSNRGGLAAARSLARAGWTVDVLGSGEGLTSRSRSVASWTALDYPGGGEDGLVRAVRDTARRRGSELVLPVDETQLLILSARRDELGAHLPYAEHAVIERATDRYALGEAAEAAGLAPPRTELAGHAELGDRERHVVKARTPALLGCDGGWSRFETSIGGPAQARRAIAEIEGAGCEAIVQEVVEGPLLSLTLLLDPDGRLIAAAQQEAERLWPIDAGTSARARTVPVDRALRDRALRLLDDLGWQGIVQLQFLRDATGTPRLIDFNPRFYGSLALAIGAGADFPALWAAAATGRPLPADREARPGVRYQWGGGELRRALREPRGARARELLRSGGWGLRAVRPVWSPSDPGPALACAARLIRSRL
jgi:predicted ATP-grasp superfamily ATP-dependent carboligase